MTSREEALVTAFEWIRNVMHQDSHGGGSSEDCNNIICSYANKVISRAREVRQ